MPSIIIDISVLGNAHHENTARTGVYRVVEELAAGALGLEGWRIYYCATQGNRPQCLRYLKANQERFVPEKYLLTGPSRVPAVIERLIDLISRLLVSRRLTGIVRLFLRILRKANKELLELLGLLFPARCAPVPATVLKECSIYHATFHAVPAVVRRQKHIMVVQTVCDLIPLKFPQLFVSNETAMISRMVNRLTFSDWTVSISQATRNDLLQIGENLDPRKARVIPLAAGEIFRRIDDIDTLAQMRLNCDIPSHGRYILSLGTLEPRKNLTRLVKAFVQLCNNQLIPDDVLLVLTGEEGWAFQSLLDTIRGAGAVRHRIIRTGYVPDEQLAPLYSDAAVFVYPSLYEGFGLPPLEAMACGAPVIVSNTSSLPEVVGDAGLLVDPKDTGALASAISSVINDAAFRDLLSRRSLERAVEFNWERFHEEYRCLYLESAGPLKAGQEDSHDIFRS